MPHSNGSGAIQFGLVMIPVKFFTATKNKDLQFNQLHHECGSRIKSKTVCPTCELELDSKEAIDRGYQFMKDQYVTIDDAELEQLQPERRKTIEVDAFIDAGTVDPIHYEKAQFLGPDEIGARPYATFVQAMKDEHKVAVARYISSNREHLTLLRPYGDALVMERLYWADEVNGTEEIVPETEIREQELTMAKTLIQALEVPDFDIASYHDTYRAQVLDLIASKAKGETFAAPAEPKRPEAKADLMEALAASVQAAKAGQLKKAA